LVFKAIKNAIKPRKKDKIEALSRGSSIPLFRVDEKIIIGAIRSR
jgi:hypothetical protein